MTPRVDPPRCRRKDTAVNLLRDVIDGRTGE